MELSKNRDTWLTPPPTLKPVLDVIEQIQVMEHLDQELQGLPNEKLEHMLDVFDSTYEFLNKCYRPLINEQIRRKRVEYCRGQYPEHKTRG